MNRILLFVFLVLLEKTVISQNTIGLPLVINYTKSDYGGGTQTWDINQDKNGIMYFANNEGLITYDGKYWKIYHLPNRTMMRSLTLDKNGRVYVGGQGEMGYFEKDSRGFLQYVSLVKRIPDAQKIFADVWDIEILNESVFFRATDRIFEFNNNSIRVFNPLEEWQFLQQIDNRIFAQDKKAGLLEFKNNQWRPLLNTELLYGELIAGLTQKGKQGILITTLKKNFFAIHTDSIIKENISSDIGAVNTDIYKSASINNNELVAGTVSEGCLIIDQTGKIVQKISRTEGLQNNNVLSVFLDKEKNLWAGLNNGISFIAYNSAVKYIKPNKNNEVAGFSTSIFKKHLYIATSDGTYNIALPDADTDLSFLNGDFSLVNNTSGQAWHLDEVNDQLLMAHNNGSFLLQNNEAIQISTAASWLFVPTSSIVPSRFVLEGTYTGLELLEFSSNKFTSKGRVEGLYESLRFLAIDNNNNIWASHPYRGIYKLELSPDQKKYTATLFTEKDGLPSALGNHVFRIRNRVVFATEKGVYEFDNSAHRFIPSPLLNPVFGTIGIRYLNEDAMGNIWFCSGKKIGVANYNAANKAAPFSITYFPELTAQILSGFENIYPYNKSNIFIGSEKGIIHLNYEKYFTNKSKMKVLLGQVKVFGKSDSLLFGGYFIQDNDTVSRQEVKDIPELPISYNSFHFEYSTPVFGFKDNIEYSYQLEGYDKRWSAWSVKTEKDFTNLPAGSYLFRIKAKDNLGNESAITNYRFVILPPWYNTIWAYVIYVLIIFMGIYFLDNWQKRKWNLQLVKFEEEQKRLKYIHQLEMEKNEKEIIQLQNDKLANEIIFKSKELADASMHLVERGDAMLKVKEELQKLYKNSGENHDIKKAIYLLNDVEKNNSNWEQFASHFDEVNNDFLKKLKQKFALLSKTDLKVCAYLQLNLSSKEIAQLMNISVRGVEISRYRLRKKLQLPTEQTLGDFLNSI